MALRHALIALAISVVGLTALPVAAQTPTGPAPGTGNASGGSAIVDRDRAREEDESTRRAANSRERRNQREEAAEVGPAERVAAATVAARAAGLTCTPAAAEEIGRTETGTAYEVTCDNGVGYMLSPAQPPEAFNCLVQAVNAERALAEDPTADLATCVAPANQDPVAAVKPYAEAAGVTCRIDQATWVGRTTDNRERFEIGCAGADGYWLESTAGGETPTIRPCFEIVQAGRQCEFTDQADQAASLQAKLQGSTTPPCTISQARYMGSNTNGAFYEAACSGAEGFVARFDAQGALTQTYPCSQAANVGGGCTIGGAATPAAATAAPIAPAATPAPATPEQQ